MASYPTAVKSFTSKANGNTIQPSHINDLQDEVNAIEAGLLNGTANLNSSNSTVANLSVTGGSTFAGAVTFSTTVTLPATVTWGAQTANRVLAGPISGGSSAATFRALDPLDLTPLFCATSAQFDKTNTALADITGLSFTVVAGKTYRFRAVLFVTEDLTGGSKVAVAGTATATTFRASCTKVTNGVTPNMGQGTTLGTSIIGQASGVASNTVFIDGYIVVNAAGTLTIQYAQVSANGTSSVLIGSTFELS